MEVKVKRVEIPMFNSFTVFEKIDPKIVEESKVITAIANNPGNLKTRVTTSFKIGQAQYGVNWKIDGFNQHSKVETSMWTYEQHEKHYFKVTTKQSHDAYDEYLKQLAKLFCEQHNIHVDVLTIELQDKFKYWK